MEKKQKRGAISTSGASSLHSNFFLTFEELRRWRRRARKSKSNFEGTISICFNFQTRKLLPCCIKDEHVYPPCRLMPIHHFNIWLECISRFHSELNAFCINSHLAFSTPDAYFAVSIFLKSKYVILTNKKRELARC